MIDPCNNIDELQKRYAQVKDVRLRRYTLHGSLQMNYSEEANLQAQKVN